LRRKDRASEDRDSWKAEKEGRRCLEAERENRKKRENIKKREWKQSTYGEDEEDDEEHGRVQDG